MESKSSKRRLVARDIEDKALDFRRAGISYRVIAERMGISSDRAWCSVNRALARLNEEISEKAEDVRRLELERLDYLQAVLAPQIDKGDTKAVSIALRICESRRKLLGLDQPTRLDVRTPTTDMVEVQEQLLKQLQSLPPEKE